MKKPTRGFTLVELLLALAITSILVILLVNVVAAALSVWEQGRNQIDTYASARQVLGRIADEIKGATASPTPLQVEFSENLTSLGTFQAGTSENVFFVTPYPNSRSGDLCVLAYRHNNGTHTLERGFVDSQTAWTGAPKYQASGYANLQWRTVASGVLEFEVLSYSQQDLDSIASPSPRPDWSSLSGGSTMIGNTPRQVVIRIKIIDDRTLVKLAGLSAGNATYDRLVNRAAQEFTASVTLPPPH